MQLLRRIPIQLKTEKRNTETIPYSSKYWFIPAMVWTFKKVSLFQKSPLRKDRRTVSPSPRFMLRINRNAHSLLETQSEKTDKFLEFNLTEVWQSLSASRHYEHLHHLFGSSHWKLPIPGPLPDRKGQIWARDPCTFLEGEEAELQKLEE